MGDTGLELTPKDTGKTGFSKTGGAESGAVAARDSETDSNLARVRAAWPSLSNTTRQVIIRLIEADRDEKSNST